MADPKGNPAAVKAGYALSVLGIGLWAVHMVLKYIVQQPQPMFLWAGLGCMLLGYVARRMGAPSS